MRVQHLTEWRTNRKSSPDSGLELFQENQLFPEGAEILQQALWMPSIANFRYSKHTGTPEQRHTLKI